MKSLLSSKKFWTAILTVVSLVVAAAANKPELADKVVWIGVALIGAIGLADHGKEAAKAKGGESVFVTVADPDEDTEDVDLRGLH